MENPPVEEKKKAFKAFKTEILVIIILVIVIVAILSYLNIFSLRSIIPGFNFGASPTPSPAPGYFDPVRAQQLKEAVINPNLPTEIRVASDISGVNFTLDNEAELIELLKNWKIFGRLYDSSSGLATGTMNNQPLERLVVHIVTEPQIANRYVNGDTVYSSSSVKLTPAQMDVYIQIDESRPEFYAQQVMFQLVTMLTKMSNPINSEAEKDARQKIIDERYEAVREESGDYFKF